MTKEDRKLIASPQFQQWLRLGLAEIIVDLGEQVWRWTEKGEKYAKYSTRTTVANFVRGLPLYPVEEDRARIEPLIRQDWLKDGFNQDGYALVDE